MPTGLEGNAARAQRLTTQPEGWKAMLLYSSNFVHEDDNKGIGLRPYSGKPEADVSSHHNPAAITAWHGGMN
jgi:hypothetical protein